MLAQAVNLARHVAHAWATAATRSPQWRALEKRWLLEQPVCQACGGARLLNVHHVVAFEHDPSRELDPTNLLTLCAWRGCHLAYGHGSSFRQYVPSVRQICRLLRAGHLTPKQAAQMARDEREPIRQAG